MLKFACHIPARVMQRIVLKPYHYVMNHIGLYLKNKIRRFKKSAQENEDCLPRKYKELLVPSVQDFADRTSENIRTIFETNTSVDLAAGEFHTNSIQLQLKLLRISLQLTSVLIIIKSHKQEILVLNSFSSKHPQNIVPGPFPQGIGIAGAVNQGHDEVYVTDPDCNYTGAFYYKKRQPVGAAAIIHVPVRLDEVKDLPKKVYLCLDREASASWTIDEKDIIRISAEKLAMDLQLGGMLTSLDQERNIIQKICQGFRELNKGLGLKTVLTATASAVTSLVSADFISISLVEKDSHQTAFVTGSGYQEQYLGLEYNLEEGLVGQVIRLNRPLPVNGQYHGPAPVFSKNTFLTGYKSLYILPLLPEEGQSLGAMTVASKQVAAFGQVQQNILQLIATQAAVKIELAKSHETINKMATTDGLTGLDNHRTFQHGFDIMLHRAKRRQSPLTLIFCDIDFFKKINDSYGHPFGDLVLKAVAKIMADTVRREDLAARYGGEEFALILENSSKKGALQLAERIRQDIADLTFSFEDESVRLTISLGIASFPEDGQEKSEIIELADQALYKAKKQGRNQTVAIG